jgi:hypothetical protein
MRIAFGIIVLIALLGLHLAALYALLHPKVSREYRAHYIDRISSDWRAQHYHSTPEEGIDLARQGWPDFVEYSFGVLSPGPFGRWTDTRMGLKSGFHFNRTFSGPVCVVLDAMPSDSMRSQQVTLAFGDQEKEFSFGRDEKIRPYLVDFGLPRPETVLALRFPKPLPRASPGNPHQVGVALNRIRIFSQPCSAIASLALVGH